MMALNYTAPGLPFLYSGVEYDLDKRLLFFEKDSFPRKAGKTYQLLKQLGELKVNHPSLHAGKDAGNSEHRNLFKRQGSLLNVLKREIPLSLLLICLKVILGLLLLIMENLSVIKMTSPSVYLFRMNIMKPLEFWILKINAFMKHRFFLNILLLSLISCTSISQPLVVGHRGARGM